MFSNFAASVRRVKILAQLSHSVFTKPGGGWPKYSSQKSEDELEKQAWAELCQAQIKLDIS